MMSNLERLAHMANQIARNFAVHGDAAAIRATADHIASFWDPRMKAQAFQLVHGASDNLGPVAAAALVMLRDRGAPAHQSQATTFGSVNDAGASDAG